MVEELQGERQRGKGVRGDDGGGDDDDDRWNMVGTIKSSQTSQLVVLPFLLLLLTK